VSSTSWATDIESRVLANGSLRFIEVKAGSRARQTITVTKNEILYSLNKPDDFILAIVEFPTTTACSRICNDS